MTAVETAIYRFQEHRSIKRIKEKSNIHGKFSFSLTSLKDIVKQINDLKIKKPTTFNNIPAKILVKFSEVFSEHLQRYYNNCITKGTFPEDMKHADVMPSYKNFVKNLKVNYRPVSILSSLSKIYERLIYEDIYQFMDKKLSPYLCGFRKGYSTQNCLIAMLEKCKMALDKHNVFGLLLKLLIV